MNLNKLINIGLVIIPAALSGGVLVVASVATISIVNNTIPQPWLSPYNDIVTNLSESEDLVDKDVLDFYQKSTVSLSFTLDGNTWTSGTAWYWGEKSNLTYFATNIHVINSLLTYNASETSKPYEERFSFRGAPLYYQFYNVNTQYNDNPSFENVKLVKIAVIDNENNTINSLPNKLLYSDLAIFSTTTKWSFGPNSNPNPVLDFIDTEQEFNYLTDNFRNLTYYISGFPHHNHKAVWTTGKYKWKYDNNLNGYNDPPSISIARANLGNEGEKNNTGLDVVGHKYYSYSRQLLLPALNFAGGSSGSLVSIVKEVNGESIIQPVGIYWGVYSSINHNNTIYKGGIDLFYSNDYPVLLGQPKFSYNNVSWWNNLPNLII